MARRLFVAAALGFALTGALTGCVSNEKYQAMKMEKDQAVEALATAQSSESQARAAAEAWKTQLDRLINNSEGHQQQAAILSKEVAELRAQNELLAQKYTDAMQRPTEKIVFGTALPEPLDTQLKALAATNPGLLEFDSARGTVKFKSDVSFAKGSADLTPQAKQVVGQLATILNSGAARNYEFLVAGHTDSTPVNNPATISAGHKDNWYLSSHRAISVGRALIGNRIDQQRIGVLGFADQRPVASNATSEGQARNRRVEVLILPTTVRGTGSASAGAAPANGVRKAPQQPNLNKDSAPAPQSGAAVDRGAVLNK